MEKEPHQPESLATVTIKPDYAPSETYSSEPPPAYHRPQSSAVQVAKIISFTVIAVSILMGCFLLASAYVTANASCKQLEQELQLLSETADRLQPLQPEALVQEEHHAATNNQVEVIQPEEKPKHVKEVQEMQDNHIAQDSSSDSSQSSSENSSDDSSDEEEKTIHIKMPLELDFDELAGALMEKNQRSRMNCIVEKKRAEQVVDHQPKTINLPFGLNLTTDPRYERVSGERMAIFCESGHEQRHEEPEESEEEEDTIMIQPVMIPIPHTNYQTHMPMQMQQQQMQPRLPQMQMQQNQIPMTHPMENLRPPMPVQMMNSVQPGFPPTQILHHIAQQIIAQKLQMEAERNQEENQSQEVAQNEAEQQPAQHFSAPEYMMAQRIPIAEDVLSQINRLPNRDVIVALSEPESEEPQQDLGIMQHQRENAHDLNGRQTYARGLPINMPVRMVQQSQEEPQAASTDEMRPHFLQPRSVRSVDHLLPKTVKRVKRCSCDCAC